MTKPLYEDPVVAEIHAIRQRMLADCNGDIRKLTQRVRENMVSSGRTVRPAPPSAPIAIQENTVPNGSLPVEASHVR